MSELEAKVGSLNVLGNILDLFYGDISFPEYCYIEV